MGAEHRVDEDVRRDLLRATAASLRVASPRMLRVRAGRLPRGGAADRLQPPARMAELDEARAALIRHPQRRVAVCVEVGGVRLDVVGRGDAPGHAAQCMLGHEPDQVAVGVVPPDPVVPVVADQDGVVRGIPVHPVGVQPSRPAEADRLLERDEAGTRRVGARVAGLDRVVRGARDRLDADLVRAARRRREGDGLRLRRGRHRGHLRVRGIGEEQRQIRRAVIPVKGERDRPRIDHADGVGAVLRPRCRHGAVEGGGDGRGQRAGRRCERAHDDQHRGRKRARAAHAATSIPGKRWHCGGVPPPRRSLGSGRPCRRPMHRVYGRSGNRARRSGHAEAGRGSRSPPALAGSEPDSGRDTAL